MPENIAQPSVPSFTLFHDRHLDADALAAIVDTIVSRYGIKPSVHFFKHPQRHVTPDATIFLAISDETWIRRFETLANFDATVVIMPTRANPLQRETFNTPATIEEVLDRLDAKAFTPLTTVVTCAEEPVLGCVTVGEALWIEREGWGQTLRHLFSIRLRPIRLTTAKGQEVQTAAMLIEAAHEASMTRRRAYFFSDSDNHCRRLAAVVYAPQSIMGALKLRLFLANRKSEGANLPAGIGTIKSDALTLQSADEKPLTLHYNGTTKQTNEVTLQSTQTRARFTLFQTACIGGEYKESVKTQNLPTDEEMIAFFAKKSLPLLPVASESAFAELFTKLRESARMGRAYLILLILSVLMATVGLFQDSAPTIIGAMILAPMMAPIIALSMGAVRFDDRMTGESLKTLLLSILIALVASALLAWALPFTHITQQIALRTHPTLLDLSVAIFAGIAAAYGSANSKVGESLAGVAIAVALVPPLSVAGIGIGWGEWSLFANAFLLFMANIVGILFAAGIMFYLMGFASRRYVSAAFFIKLAMVAIIAVPLWLSTRTLVLEERIYGEFQKALIHSPFGKGITMSLKRIEKRSDGLYLYVTLTASVGVGHDELAKIAKYLKKRLGENLHFVFSVQASY